MIILILVVFAIAVPAVVVFRRLQARARKLEEAMCLIDKAFANGSIDEVRKIRKEADSLKTRISQQLTDCYHLQAAETQQAVRSISELAQECSRRINAHE
jgi:hypothetical protein